MAQDEQENAAARASIERTRNGARARSDNFQDEGKGIDLGPVPQSRALNQTSTTIGPLLQMRKASRTGGKMAQPGVEVYASV